MRNIYFRIAMQSMETIGVYLLIQTLCKKAISIKKYNVLLPLIFFFIIFRCKEDNNLFIYFDQKLVTFGDFEISKQLNKLKIIVVVSTFHP